MKRQRKACPLCESTDVTAEHRSIRKDMSLEGFCYAKCGRCGTYYERDVTEQAIDAFYRSLGPYESSSAKDSIVDDLARSLRLTGREHALDLGCGSGAWSIPVLRHVAHVTCVDLDAQAQLAVARRCTVHDDDVRRDASLQQHRHE